ncbi:hypothetical protein pb186bvf_017405 [Paramecium bursaria]
MLYVIGKGGFGRVWKVRDPKTNELWAMKEMSKKKIVKQSSQQSVMNERNLLTKLRHQFLVNMKCSFQSSEYLYIVMDLMEGGDLRYHMKNKTFTEDQTSKYLSSIEFMVACILLGLQFLHENVILHRDIKPENLVFNLDGYLKITDLGIARYWKPSNLRDTSGTPGYMAPEIVFRQNHGVAVDYFALGVIVFECLTGKRPYSGRSRKEIREQFLTYQAQLPQTFTLECQDFVNQLLMRKQENRLGHEGPEQVIQHRWLKDVNWEEIIEQKYNSPIKIIKKDNFDNNYVNRTSKSCSEEFNQSDFQNYTFITQQTESQTYTQQKLTYQKQQILYIIIIKLIVSGLQEIKYTSLECVLIITRYNKLIKFLSFFIIFIHVVKFFLIFLC